MPASALVSSAAAQPLRWRTPQQLQRLGSGLQALLDDWSRHWGLTGVVARLDNAWQATSPTELAWQPIAVGTNGTVVAWMAHGPRDDLMLERLLFGSRPGTGPTEPEASTLSLSLARDALAALRRTSAQWLGAAEPESGTSDAPRATDGRPWSGAVRAEIALGPADDRLLLWLHIRAEALARASAAGSTSRPTLPALAALPEALADHHLKLRARLADVQVSLGELIGLREGDVLVTGHRLADPLSVYVPGRDAPPLFGGNLVQRNGRMAVALLQAS